MKVLPCHKKNKVCSLVLLAKRKKEKSEGIKCFYVQNDLEKGEESSAHQHPQDLANSGGYGCQDEVQGLRETG